MTRLYGRAHGGERCLDSAPCGHWETVTILSSIRLDGSTQSLVFEGAVDRKMFDAYIKEVLAPTLCPGDVVIMDNLNAHKSQEAYDEIRKRQAEVLFLPAYSPDFNPIEKMWSKVKQVLRGIKARTPGKISLPPQAQPWTPSQVAMPRAGLSHVDIQRFKIRML